MQVLRRPFSFAAIAALGLLAACGDDVSVTPPQEPLPAGIASVTVNPASVTIAVGEKVVMSASVATTQGTGSPATTVAWSSSNATIASVSASGEVTGNAAGTTTIVATSTADNSKKGAGAVTVRALQVRSVSVTPTSAALGAGQTMKAVATVDREGNLAGTVTWSTSAASVATVATDGTITAVAAGTAVITATSTADNTKSASLAVTVTPLPQAVTSLTVAPTEARIAVNDKLKIVPSATVASGASDAAISFSSSNTAVATVNATTGEVSAVAPGTAVITTKAKSTITVGNATRSDSLTALSTITVGNRASVSIASLTQYNTLTPVDLDAVEWQVNATLNIDPGVEKVEKVEVYIGSKLAAAQDFGVNGAPAAPVVLTVNTAEFDDNYVPKWNNGKTSIEARIYVAGATTPTATNSVQFTLANVDHVYFDGTLGSTAGGFGIVHTGPSASTPAPATPTTWYKGGFTFRPRVVNYSQAIDSIEFSVSSSVAACDIGVAKKPAFVATADCSNIEADQWIDNYVRVFYPSTYTLTWGVTQFAGRGYWPYFANKPEWSQVVTHEDNVGPTVNAVAYNGVNVAGWHGTGTTYAATATDNGVGMAPGAATAATPVDISNNGGTTFAFLNITAASQLAETNIPTVYSARGRAAADRLGNLGNNGPVAALFGVDLNVTDAQYANRATSNLTNVFPLDKSGTIYTAATWATQEAAKQFVAVDAIDINGSGLDNATALTQTIVRSVPSGASACLALTTYPMGTILADQYAQTTTPQEIDCALAAGSRTGRYSWSAYVKDRAGNALIPRKGAAGASTQLDSVYILIDESAPNITGIGFQLANYTGGQPASFSFSANDNYEIKDGLISLKYDVGTWANTTPVITYDYGSAAFTTSGFSASPWDNTYVNVLNGQTLTLGYLLGAVDATDLNGSTAGFKASGIINNSSANVRDWAGQTAAGISANILPTQVTATAGYAWATTSASGATVANNMTKFVITTVAANSVTVQQTGATATSLYACSRIDIFELVGAGVAGGKSVDDATVKGLTYVSSATFTSANFTDNGVNRFFTYTISKPTTTGSGVFAAACVQGGRALFSPSNAVIVP